ncbi:MAG: hypothetical protein GC155_09070 [Alphaproteobacteria bacterium]|nr:hypothetical protein [Alphaproteobacteria bacterium]
MQDAGHTSKGQARTRLTPRRLQFALLVAGVLLGLLAAVNLLIAAGAILAGQAGAALVQLTGGLAIPFAIWLGLRMVADMLILQQGGAGWRAAAPVMTHPPDKPETAASDDGPAYPQED